MQTISNIPTDYKLTQYFVPFYEQYSVKALPTEVHINTRLGKVLSIVNKKANLPLSVSADDTFFISANQNPTDGKRIAYIGFSGGKDCLATAIRAKQDGYEPVLVYVGGVNKSLFSERRHAESVAKAIGFEYKELKIIIGGNKEWNEHPLKNILILCLLIDEGLKNGVTAFGFGSSFDDDSTYGSLDYDLSDSFDMFHAFAFFVRQFVPNFQLLHYMCNTLQSFYTCYKYNKHIIPLLSTCITPDYRKPMIRKYNIAKYGADLLSVDGCGGCYKCADEYLYKQKFGLVRSSREYAVRCVEIKRAFDTKYGTADFRVEVGKYNRYGGYNTEQVQVLCDRCGYFIGQLVYDKETNNYFTHKAFGHKHFANKEYAELLCERFIKLYKL